jgi:hypothetical protein
MYCGTLLLTYLSYLYRQINKKGEKCARGYMIQGDNLVCQAQSVESTQRLIKSDAFTFT